MQVAVAGHSSDEAVKPLLALAALASALIAAAVVLSATHRREYPMARYVETDDGVQPWDVPPDWRCSRYRATGLYPQAWPA